MEILLLVLVIMLSLSGLFYSGLIGFFTIGWFREIKGLKGETLYSGLKVSVIIAARDEEKNIAYLLNDLSVQDYSPALIEVIVIDDHSTDSTSKIVTDFITLKKLSGFKLVKNEDPKVAGKKAAITSGVAESTGDLIITTDADCRVGPGWISVMASYFADETKVMILGPVAYFPRKGIMNGFQSLEFCGLMASGAGAARAGHPFICNGASLAYRKSAFQKVNGYAGDESYISGDDVFLLHKMKKKFGSKAIGFALDRRSLVQTDPAPGLLAFVNQRIRWASKSKAYRDALAISTAFVVFTFNLILLYTLFAGFFNTEMFFLFAGFILLKSLTDVPLMLGVTGFTGNRKLFYWYLPFQIVYPFYVVVAGVLSLFPRRKW